MGSLEDIKGILWGGGKKPIAIARLNALISQEESKMGSIYYQIGEMYVRIHGNDGEKQFSNMIEAITDSKYKIEDYKRQLQYLKTSYNYGCIEDETKIQKNSPNERLMQCPNCKMWVEIGTRYCVRCGKMLGQPEKRMDTKEPHCVQEKTCPVCGRRVKEGASFCTKCGTEL